VNEGSLKVRSSFGEEGWARKIAPGSNMGREGKKYPDYHPKKHPIGNLSFLALIEVWF